MDISEIDGKYRIVRTLGTGTVGAVFEAEHVHLGSKVAVKVMHDDLSPDGAMCTRFLTAARNATQVKHSAVANIVDVGVGGGRPYVVSELCAGRSLRTVLRAGRLELDVACGIGMSLLAALAAGHERRLLHRDLKPENVMVSFESRGNLQVKVLDFGLSYSLFGDDPRHQGARWAHASPRYSAPECLVECRADERSDMYSFAAILYEMLSGQPLIDSPDAMNAVRLIASSDWQPLARVNPNLPEPLVRAIEATLDGDPERRIETPHDFARHLAPYLTTRRLRRNQEQLPTLDPVLRFSRRLPVGPEAATPSLRLNRAPKPRGALGEDMLTEPVFPRTPHAPRLESLNASA
ncbi:MAG: hypothetical protein RJA70_3427, partial [Pseudomonadota bacterium]